MDSESPIQGSHSALFNFATRREHASRVTQFLDLRNRLFIWPLIEFEYSIPANATLTDTTVMISAYDVSTGELLDFDSTTSARRGGYDSILGTDLNGSNGHLVRIEISWLNGSATSGATIELDYINIWKAFE